eukprot:11455352-Heterocapsa_arctica.AAC.1
MHEATHLPFAAWCGECVGGRGKDAAHHRQYDAEGPPLVQLDYSFLRTGAMEDSLVTLLLAFYVRVG